MLSSEHPSCFEHCQQVYVARHSMGTRMLAQALQQEAVLLQPETPPTLGLGWASSDRYSSGQDSDTYGGTPGKRIGRSHARVMKLWTRAALRVSHQALVTCSRCWYFSLRSARRRRASALLAAMSTTKPCRAPFSACKGILGIGATITAVHLGGEPLPRVLWSSRPWTPLCTFACSKGLAAPRRPRRKHTQ